MDEDESGHKTTGSRALRKRSGRFTTPEQVPRFHCDVCKRDISRKIRIKCADCQDFDLCVECFAVGVEYQDHKKTHRYRVIGDLSFPVFSSSWGADEELLFFDGICGYGIDNWEAVSHFVGSKSPDACKTHYIELIDHLQLGDDDSELPDPKPSKILAPNAFPFEFDSDECGASPRSLSPVSSMDLSQDSLVLDDNEDMPVEWLTGSITTPKSSLAEGDPNVSTFLSDYEGTNEMEIDNTTEGDHPSTQNLHQEINVDKLDEMPEQVNKSGSDGLELMDQSSMEDGSDQDNVDSNHNDSSINNSRKRIPPPVTSASKSGKAQKEGSKSKPPTNSHQTMNHSVDPLTGNGLAPRSLSSLDTNAGDVTGYNPFRCEFDPPYDPGAEQMIADLEFLDDDTEEVTRAKLKLLDLYRWRVHQREKRTEKLKKNEYGLLDVKKIQAMEKHHHSWLMNELCADLRAFARYKSLQKIETLAKGLFMERTLRNRIHELQEARSLGCRTFSDIRTRHKDSRIPKSAERTNAQLIGKWRRHGHPKNRTPDLVPELNDRERQFCVEASFSPWQYAVLRDRILREAEEHGGRFSKIHVKNFFRLECTQSIKLFDFFVSEGKFANSDKDSTGIKKQPN